MKKYYFISYALQLKAGTTEYAFFQTVTDMHPFEWCSGQNKSRVGSTWTTIVGWQEINANEYVLYCKLLDNL